MFQVQKETRRNAYRFQKGLKISGMLLFSLMTLLGTSCGEKDDELLIEVTAGEMVALPADSGQDFCEEDEASENETADEHR